MTRMRPTGNIGRAAGVCVVLGVLVIGGGLGGCNRVSKADYEAAMAENQELRKRNGDLEMQVAETNTRNGSLQQENADWANRADGSGQFGKGTNTYTRGSDVVVDIAGDVLFDSGSATIKSSAKKTLDGIASALNGQYSGNAIRVEGYTDTDPIKKSGWKTNERLGAERAMAVEAYLVSKGVSNGRVYSATFGPASPKANKKDSRRVEIVILGNS